MKYKNYRNILGYVLVENPEFSYLCKESKLIFFQA